MKKIIVAGLLAVGLLFAAKQTVQAQVHVNINIGQQPLWGPVGYDYVQYYYIPELNVYYDVINGMYIYPQRNRWINAVALPPRFGHFDLFMMHKVVINQMNPFRYNHNHRKQYGHYRGQHPQLAIRDARDYRYYANPRHPRHREYQGYRQQHNSPQRNRPVQGGARHDQRMTNRPQQGHRDMHQRQPNTRQQQAPAQMQESRMSQRSQMQHRDRGPQQRGQQRSAPQQRVQQRQYVERKSADRGQQGRGQANRSQNERGQGGRR